MVETLITRHSTKGGAFDGDWSRDTRYFLRELAHKGWRVVSTSVLQNGLMLVFWENANPPSDPVSIPDDVDGTYL